MASFVTDDLNADWKTVESFGDEWNRFASFTEERTGRAGDQYFDIVTREMANDSTRRSTSGAAPAAGRIPLAPCAVRGSGRPGEAVRAAVPYTAPCGNVRITQAGYGSVCRSPRPSFDFVFSLGVVHHVPETGKAIAEAASMLKDGGWLLLYVYYSLDNRGALYRATFRRLRLVRRMISRLPRRLSSWPATRSPSPRMHRSWCCAAGCGPSAGKAGTRAAVVRRGQALEGHPQRLTRSLRDSPRAALLAPPDRRMLIAAGLKDIRFSDHEPFWHVVARK